MIIKKFNANWSSGEDRILLRINSIQEAEYCLWLSRHQTKILFEKSINLISLSLSEKHNSKIAGLVEGFQRQNLQNKIYSNNNHTKANKYPLGEEPILVIGVNIIKKNNQLNLILRLKSSQKIIIPMDIVTLQSLVYLLEKIQNQSSWNLKLNFPDITIDSRNSNILETKKIVH